MMMSNPTIQTAGYRCLALSNSLTKLMQSPIGLSVNQRNLYMYFLNHIEKRPDQPCYVPRLPNPSRLKFYITAIQRLEEHKLVAVDRTAKHYTRWILKKPE